MVLKITISYKTRRYYGGLKDELLRVKVKDKEQLNNPMKGCQILNAISSLVFHTVHWSNLCYIQCLIYKKKSKGISSAV